MNFTTTSIMPLLARFVIAAAMLTSGWVNCFSQIQIRSEIVEVLQSKDIEVHEQTIEITEGETDITEEATTQQTHYTTLGVNRIVWMMHDRWPDIGGWGALLAWTAAVAQLLGGVLLVVGLFTRLAALVVCVATGMAIYLVSAKMHGMFAMNPFEWPLDSHRFIQLFAGVGLFVLSLGLLFGGAGSFSLDHRHATHVPEKKVKVSKNSAE